jgi:hypothetical protein
MGRQIDWLAVMVMSLVLATVAGAGAQATSAESGYEQLVQRGVAQYQQGHWHEARGLFEQAHQLQPNARTLRGLGMTSYQLGEFVQALGFFEQSLVSPQRPLGPDLRTEVTRYLREAERLVARLQLQIEPEHATVTIDGAATRPNDDSVILLEAGPHELSVHASGHVPLSRRLVAKQGQEIYLQLVLPAQETVAAAGAVLPPPPSAARGMELGTVEEEPPLDESLAPFVVVGVAGAVMVTGGVLLGVALAEKAEIEGAPRGSRTWSETEAAFERVPVFSAVGAVMLGVGGLGVAAGLAWHWWPQAETQRAGVEVGLGVGAALMQGRF